MMDEGCIMERLKEIKKRLFEISSLDDYLNVMSSTVDVAKEMSHGTYTQEELDLFNRICSVLEHRPDEFHTDE